MILDIFSELQSTVGARDLDARRLLSNTVEQAKLADELGFGCWWAVEHHTSPEFSMSSAPDLLLTLLSQHTQRMRLGTAGILAPFEINHPVRIAERAAFVDVLSNGRLELGLARSGGAEWATFGTDPDSTRQQLREAFEMLPRIWSREPFSWDSEVARIPEREFVPKPLQHPHPPLWQTVAGPESCEGAGELGVGMLGSSLFAPLELLEHTLALYAKGLARCPIEPAARNEKRAIFSFVHCTETRREAIESRAAEAALWFMNEAPRVFRVERSNWVNLIRGNFGKSAAGSEMLDGPEAPPTEDELNDPVPVIALMNRLRAGQALDPEEAFDAVESFDSVMIGDVDSCRRKLRRIESMGVDRLMCLMQFGTLTHDAVMSSLRTTGKLLVPEFQG